MHFIVQCAVAFVATVAFAALFHVPPVQYAYAGVTGAAGWAFYLLSLQLHPSPVAASFVATVVLAVLARAFAVVRQCPSTVFLISGIFPLVPGVGIYYTTYYFIMSDNALAAAKGAETFKIAVAIALGIVAVASLPGGLFAKLARHAKK